MSSRDTRQNGQLTGISHGDTRRIDNLNDNLLKLRAVLALMAAPRGTKRATAATLSREMKQYGLKAAVRSLYRWQNRFLCDGLDGIARRQRSDFGRQHFTEELLASINSVSRGCRSGNISREYRRLRPAISYETFRAWVRRLQAGFDIAQARAGGGKRGLFF